MDAKQLENALDRAERALIRIERSVEHAMHGSRDEQLRGKVADVLAELDGIIREAGR